MPVERLVEGDRLSRRVIGPQRLAVPVRVVLNDLSGGLQDGLGGAVVLFELHDRGVGVVLLELQNVADVGSSPPVDRLIIISHHADVAVPFGQRADDEILGAIRILVLVDKNVLEALLILFLDIRRLAE